ncbi:MAG: PTS sugar transporter subunit IIA [Erysipelotrichaceae bacterium]|nr:PTS sugar transporter subunit IIA [Erysipelotrichaceae bacterium]
MDELVGLDQIDTQVEVSSWKEAVYAAGQLLIDSGDIDKSYLDDMVKSVETYGPYIVISKGFALAHAAPCEAVKHSAVSLINLKEGVDFGSPNDPVKVVMCLACTDKESHIGQLQKIARKLMVEGTIGRLAACETKEELYQIINEKEVDEL